MEWSQIQDSDEQIIPTKPWYKREQLITISRGLFFLLLFIGGIFLAILLFVKNEVVDQDASRSLVSSMVFLNHSVPVKVNVSSNNLPVCQPQSEKKSVVLLLDQSGSMGGVPFEREMEGAERIINNVDLTNTEIAIVAFNDTAKIHSSWSADSNYLLNSLESGIVSTGGTDIAASLSKAQELFKQKDEISGQENYALLFTDGGSDHSMAIQEAQALKTLGVRLFVVGLEGDDFDQDLLSNLVDNPGDLLITDDPNEIVTLFGQVASLINKVKVKQLVISEPINTDAFLVDEKTITINTLNQIVMQKEELKDSEPIGLSYEIKPKKIGFFDIASEEGNIRFLDCEEQLHTYVLPAGPRLVVLPPLICLLLGYFFPLIGFGTFGFIPRKPEKIWRTPNYTPDYEEPENPLPSLNAIVRRTDVQETDLKYSPTLIIGLGATGYVSLNNLKKHLLEAGEGKMPKGVRLLWISGNSPENQFQEDDYLDATNEKHVIKTEFDRIEIETSGSGVSSGFSWWKSQNSDPNDRTNGRMSFFYDVLFSPAKPLKKRLETITNQFMTEGYSSYRVFIISSPVENESAFMPDLVYWLRRHFTEKVNRILPWLLLKPIYDNDPEKSAARRFAAMREIQRFMISPNQLMETEDGKYSVQDGFLFDGCMVFDQSSNPDATLISLIESVCDQILLLIEEGVAQKFDQEMTDFMGKVGDRQENSLFVTSNGFSFYLPVEPIRRVCEVRLITDFFFASGNDKAVGYGMLTEKPIEDGDYSMAIEFLRWRHDDLDNSAFQLLADVMQNGWEEGVVDYFPRNLADGYQWKLITYLNMLMNSTHKFSDQGNGLAFWRARCLLEQLNSLLDSAEINLETYRSTRGKEHATKELLSNLGIFRQINEKFLAELTQWKHAFNEKRSSDAHLGRSTARRSFSSIRSDSKLVEENELKSLASDLELLYRQRIEELNQALTTTDTKSVVLDPQLLTNSQLSGQEIVDFYYHEHLLSTNDNDQSELTRLASQIGWHWSRNEEASPELTLVMLGEKPTINSDIKLEDVLTFELSEFPKFSKSLFSIAPTFSKVLRTRLNLSDLLKNQESEVIECLERERDDRLLNYVLINDANYCQQRPYLLHPDSEQAFLWSQQTASQQFEVMQIKNKTRATGIWFVFKVPDSIISLLKEDKKSYYCSAELHVFPAEQFAAEKEAEMDVQPGKNGLLHPKLIRLMNNRGLFDCALNCLLYGWLKKEEDDLGNSFFVIETDDVEPFRLECAEVKNHLTLEDALINMTVLIPWKCLDDCHPLHKNNLKRTIDLLNKEIDKERSKPYEDREKRFEYVREKMIEKWLRSSNIFEHDLAKLLELMIKKEMKYL